MSAAPDAETTIVYLVRHGATDANRRKPYILQGCGIDLELSETGRAQAEAASRFLADFPIRRIYSSEMKRAVETGGIIGRPHGLTAEPVANLTECNVGQWEGLDWGTIAERFPNEHRAFHDNPGEVPYLGGESYGDVQRRVVPVINGLAERHRGEAILIVAHNVVNRAYLARAMKVDLRYAKEIHQANTGVNVIRYRAGTPEVLTLNAHFHLSRDLL